MGRHDNGDAAYGAVGGYVADFDVAAWAEVARAARARVAGAEGGGGVCRESEGEGHLEEVHARLYVILVGGGGAAIGAFGTLDGGWRDEVE